MWITSCGLANPAIDSCFSAYVGVNLETLMVRWIECNPYECKQKSHNPEFLKKILEKFKFKVYICKASGTVLLGNISEFMVNCVCN